MKKPVSWKQSVWWLAGTEGEKSGEMLITGNIYDECVLGT